MKNFIIILISLISFNAKSQFNVSFTFEDAYSFNRIENSYLLVTSANKTEKLYKSDNYGTITLKNLSKNISVAFYSENYKTINSNFKITNNIEIKAILEPKITYIEDKYTERKILIEAVVKNKHTGENIKNAVVKFEDFNIELKTNNNGKIFLKKENIENYSSYKEGDSLLIEINAANFEPYKSVFRFSRSKEIKGIFLNPLKNIKNIYSNPINNNKIILKIKESINFQQNNSKYKGNLNFPTSIKVGTNCNCNTCSSVSTMSLETYVQKGLNDEWISSWGAESLKAGSLPYKTYGAYHVLHPLNSTYDISNTTCRQVWDSDYASSCINAANATIGQFLVTSDNNIAFSEYSAENNGLNAPSEESCGDGYAGTGSSYPCISDNVCTGHDRFGHGRGMCQWGTQRWSNEGKDYKWITDHYYLPGGIHRSEDSSSGVLDCSSSIDLSLETIFHGESSTEASKIETYGCNDWSETGPERIHTINLEDAGTITASISNFTGDLDVYILGSCDPSDCLGTVSSSYATYENAPKGTYYIVVDADDGSGSKYDLLVSQLIQEDSTIFENKFSIKPNPSKGIFYIEPTNEIIKEVTVYNITKQEILKTFSHKINLQNYPVGIYFVEIINNKNEKEILKIIKN